MLPPTSHARRSSTSTGTGSDMFARSSILSTASSARAERQPLLSGAPPPQVFAHPLECASLTSRLLLQWVTPSVTLANRSQTLTCPPQYQTQFQLPRGRGSATKRGLQQADVWELPPRARAEPGANALHRAWISSGSLSLAFIKSHGLKFTGLGVLHAVVQLCDLMGPYVLFRGVLLLQEQGQEDRDDNETRRCLLFWLGALLFSRLLRVLLSAFVRTELQTLTLRLTAALQSLVFQKALRLSNSSTREAYALYVADVTHLLQGAACVHELWAAPLTLALILALIDKFLGVAACGAFVGAVVVTIVVSQVLNQLQFRSLDRLRRTREDRENSTKDLVRAMPAVKLHAWEPAARVRVNATRSRELAALWRFLVRGAAEAAFNFATPVLLTTAALAVGYHSSTHSLTPASVFATLALVRLVQTPLRTLPEAALGARAAWQSMCNLSHFMDQEELNPYAVARRDSLGLVAKYDPQDVVVAVEDATLGWATNGPVVFQHLDVTVGAGELLMVHGRPGSGKSSFLSALLGEMQARDGSDGGGGGRVYVGGSVAYCPQQPWLQQALSVRDNVLFGLPFDRRKYQRVLDACALVNPIAMLPAGDHTLIQDWTPSSGQQALVSLARACYSDADVYLLDEPLARVHPRSTAREIFSRCLLGLLRNKTRVVVTTRAEFITSEFADDAIRFEDGGRLVHTRDIYEVKGRKEQERDEDSDEEEEKAAEDNWVNYAASGVDVVSTCDSAYFPTEKPADIEQLSMENIIGTTRYALNERPLREYLSCETSADAEWNEGEGLRKSIRSYTQLIGGFRVALVLFVLLFIWQALQLLSELWVAYWVRSSSQRNLAADQLIYASLALGAGLLSLGYSLGIAMAAVEGARRAFLSLTSTFLHASLVFFDAFGTGSGRARSKRLSLARRRHLERVYTDKSLTDLDTRLPLAVGAVLALGVSTLTALLTAAMVARYYAVLFVPVVYMYVQAMRLYVRPARDLLHLERAARQATRTHAAETLSGARVVRAFGLAHVHRVLGHHFWLLDVAARDAHLGLHVDQWLALRVQLYGTVIVGIVAASSFLALRNTLSASVLALAIYEALVVDGGALESLVRMWTWLIPVLPTAARTETAARGAEVIIKNAANSTAAARRASAPLTPNEVNPSLSWPTKGDLRFDAVSFRDPAAAIVDELTDMFEIGDGGAPPLALKGVSFRLQAGDKVAILESSAASSVSSVGRALLRLHELTAGRIVVDGVDISTLGLRTLHSRVACVSAVAPSAALYDNSVRTQLDPSGADIDDERLWAALRVVGLASDVATLDGPLPGVSGLQQNPMKRFLLSLARALLCEPSVVALALAPVLVPPPDDELQLQPELQFSLDDATLEILQHVVHDELRDATVLLLLPSATASPQHDQVQRAMLLNAVDRVLVLVDGELAELGTSADLSAHTDRLETLAEVPSRLELSDLEVPSEETHAAPELQEDDREQEHHARDSESVTSGEFVMDTTDSAIEFDTDSAVETE